ncbi:hypothetical protein GR160_14345 [Flavobacterium sp. Sd200]|uniref:glycosyltransferase family 2 protein n=1 Tax=Flavobacterium sp. Sd200 TaxID=2692211 RepID=UPI001369BEAD|nr:glycosyltransferase family A protein [Flavobacterium sp. Sd200]MXN92405.1 hypothetical protein [Flavobacterium sp. Sd200]
MAEAFKQSDVEILVATMHRNTLDFLVPMFPYAPFYSYNILVINQTTAQNIITSPYPSVRVINSFERGLGKSRNVALQNAVGRLAMLADDDVIFTEGFDTAIANAFNILPDAALIKFKAETFEGMPFQKYASGIKKCLNAIDRLNIMSIEIAVNTALIKKSGVLFDTRFGLGSIFPLSEEPVFVNDLHNKGYKMGYVPKVIETHKPVMDSGNINLSELYRIKGAIFQRIFKSRYNLWLGIQLFFHIKHGVIKFGDIKNCIKTAAQGRKQYLESIK